MQVNRLVPYGALQTVTYSQQCSPNHFSALARKTPVTGSYCNCITLRPLKTSYIDRVHRFLKDVVRRNVLRSSQSHYTADTEGSWQNAPRKALSRRKGLQPPEDGSGTPAQPYVSSVTVFCLGSELTIFETSGLLLLLQSLALSAFTFNNSIILLTHTVVFCV